MLTVLAPPPLLTVQDLGRPGHRAVGVPAGGAMDRWALAGANLLVGNDAGAAALEWVDGGGSIRLDTPCAIALCGARVEGDLDGCPVAGGRVREARAGSVLTVGRTTAGRVLYLAVAGGIAVPPVLGSRATYLPAAVGGLEGRRLGRGDRLAIGEATAPSPPPGFAAPGGLLDPLPPPVGCVRVVRGPHAELLPDEGWDRFLASAFRVSPTSDRTGYRLEGPGVTISAPPSLPSEPTCPGAIQLPPGGEPIVLMADAPTVGGYPVPAVVCSADLGRLAQLRAGATVRFVLVEPEQAERLYRRRRVALHTLGELARHAAG